MKPIVVYTTNADVPETLRCLAYFKEGNGLFGVRFNGPTPEAVRNIAETWWVEETARQAKIKGGPKSAREKPAADETAVQDDIEQFGDLL